MGCKRGFTQRNCSSDQTSSNIKKLYWKLLKRLEWKSNVKERRTKSQFWQIHSSLTVSPPFVVWMILNCQM